MARPKSDDPKVPMSLRVPASVLALWEAKGEDWRAQAEALLSAQVRLVAARVEVLKPIIKARPFVSRLKGEWKAP